MGPSVCTCGSGKTTAVILAAGYATRLYPLTLNIPKPLLNIQKGRTVIDFIADQLATVPGLGDIRVVTNRKFYGAFRSWAKRRPAPRRIDVLNDGTTSNEDRLGAIGDLDFAVRRRRVDGDVIVFGGDNLFDRGFGKFVEFARARRPSCSLGLFDIGDLREATRFGVVAIDRHGKVRSFQEKPARPKSTLVATCLYYFPEESLGLLSRYMKDPATPKDAPGNYIRWLLGRGTVYGFPLRKGHWFDIGHFSSYQEVVAQFNRFKTT